MELSFPIKQEELRKKLRIKKDLKTALRKKDAVHHNEKLDLWIRVGNVYADMGLQDFSTWISFITYVADFNSKTQCFELIWPAMNNDNFYPRVSNLKP